MRRLVKRTSGCEPAPEYKFLGALVAMSQKAVHSDDSESSQACIHTSCLVLHNSHIVGAVRRTFEDS